LTSQAAGAWLEFVLRRGLPLLSGDAPVTSAVIDKEKLPELAA
jgi:hypothetical protein